MLGGVIITLVITLLYERGQFRKLDKLEEISKGVADLKKTFDDSVKATLQDFSDKAFETLASIAKTKVKQSSKSNPHPPTDSRKKPIEENENKERLD
jgi:hypothetical protein